MSWEKTAASSISTWGALQENWKSIPSSVSGSMLPKSARGAEGGRPQTAYYEKKEDFYQDKDRFIGNGDIILVKGSRGMKMEQVVENILKR